MWLSAIKLAVSTGSKIYANKQRQKEAMSQAALLTAEKMARGETEYQGKVQEYEKKFKGTSIGARPKKVSSMNKSKRKGRSKQQLRYKGQGK